MCCTKYIFSNTGVPHKMNTHNAFNTCGPVSGPCYYACWLADMQSQLSGAQPSFINAISHTCAFSALTRQNDCSGKSLYLNTPANHNGNVHL